MNGKNPKVDAVLSKAKKWREEFERLRNVILESQLTEELKWGNPCYSFDGKNVVLIHGFKEYCALLFFKGALLKDPRGILIQQTENVQAARQIRFTGVREIVQMEPVLKAYVRQAIEVEKAGLKVKLKKPDDFKMAEEFQSKLDEIPGLKTASSRFDSGSAKRHILLYFRLPKQSKTRVSRSREKQCAINPQGQGIR